ncbi:hypothetical protein I4F81_003853 [Pyropia yezoensis]|uniref:Uncharacterized protein n=1 Tax=Pyropia yezoensis TaxID=2788 RepID=A0ACC3BTH9_PYRYE|nr:hypothetical protein I4F81_003853 [Neopyropia yezoensis]
MPPRGATMAASSDRGGGGCPCGCGGGRGGGRCDVGWHGAAPLLATLAVAFLPPAAPLPCIGGSFVGATTRCGQPRSSRRLVGTRCLPLLPSPWRRRRGAASAVPRTAAAAATSRQPPVATAGSGGGTAGVGGGGTRGGTPSSAADDVGGGGAGGGSWSSNGRRPLASRLAGRALSALLRSVCDSVTGLIVDVDADSSLALLSGRVRGVSVAADRLVYRGVRVSGSVALFTDAIELDWSRPAGGDAAEPFDLGGGPAGGGWDDPEPTVGWKPGASAPGREPPPSPEQRRRQEEAERERRQQRLRRRLGFPVLPRLAKPFALSGLVTLTQADVNDSPALRDTCAAVLEEVLRVGLSGAVGRLLPRAIGGVDVELVGVELWSSVSASPAVEAARKRRRRGWATDTDADADADGGGLGSWPGAGGGGGGGGGGGLGGAAWGGVAGPADEGDGPRSHPPPARTAYPWPPHPLVDGGDDWGGAGSRGGGDQAGDWGR